MKTNEKYIHGARWLTSEDVEFNMHVDIGDGDEHLIELCMELNFNVDAVFGTNVSTLDNDETLSVFAYFDRCTGNIRPDLRVVLWTDDGWSEDYLYTLNSEEKSIVLSKVSEYCAKENLNFQDRGSNEG